MTTDPQDPTRAGAPVAGTAILSLPEIDSLCMKAARGAGFDWGMAEEAGYAARWLASAGMPGPELILAHLEAQRGKNWGECRPDMSGRVWAASGASRLCPIAAGTAISDRAARPGDRITLQQVGFPALLLPFLALALRGREGVAELHWTGGTIAVDATHADDPAGSEHLAASTVADVEVRFAEGQIGFRRPDAGRKLEREQWQRLDTFALRTTVPASAQSRAGAGAATSDND